MCTLEIYSKQIYFKTKYIETIELKLNVYMWFVFIYIYNVIRILPISFLIFMEIYFLFLFKWSLANNIFHYCRNDDPEIEDYGNKWSLGALLRYLRSHGKDTAGMYKYVAS